MNDLSLECYNKSLELNPENDLCYNDIGYLYQFKFNNEEKALKFYSKAIEINPLNATPLNNKGLLLKKKGLFLEAEKLYKMAIKINCYDIFCNNYISLLEIMNKTKAALYYLSKDVMKYSHKRCFSRYSELLSKNGKFLEAEKWRRKSLE